MFRRFVPITVIAGFVGLVAIACGGGASPAPAPQPQSPPVPPPAAAPAAPGSSSGTSGQAPQTAAPGGTEFEVNLQDPGGSGTYVFDPDKMTFSVGDSISFTFKAETEFHTFTVDDLDIDVEVDGGETVTFTHTFDQAGTFELICIPHVSLGMMGEITVQ